MSNVIVVCEGGRAQAFKQACDEFIAAQTCDEDRETAEDMVKAANAIMERALAIEDFLFSWPEGEAQ